MLSNSIATARQLRVPVVGSSVITLSNLLYFRISDFRVPFDFRFHFKITVGVLGCVFVVIVFHISLIRKKMAAKRKKLTIHDKLKIIQDVANNSTVSLTDMAKKYDLAPSTLHGVLKQKESILAAEVQCGSAVKKRKNFRSSPFEEIENVLMKWFEARRSENVPIDGNILKEKARQIALTLHVDNFCASNGSLDRFKKRHNLYVL